MTYRDLCCGCPTLVTFPVGRVLVCVSPFLELPAVSYASAVSVTTAADFAPQPTGAVVTPISPPDIGDCTGTEVTALDPPTEVLSENFGAAGSPANAPTPERDDFGVTNSTSQAKATEGKAGTAGVTGLVRRSTAGMGLRVGEASADLPATSENMDATAGETAPSPRTLKNGSAARAVRWGLDLQRLPCTSIPNGGSLKSFGVALCVSHKTLLATPASGSGAAAGETATNSEDALCAPERAFAVARYPSPTLTFCIGCDAPAFGFFCPACADIDATISTLEALWLRAKSNSPAMASPGSKGAAFPPMTAEASASIEASAFSVEIEPIDIPDFLPCRSIPMETP